MGHKRVPVQDSKAANSSACVYSAFPTVQDPQIQTLGRQRLSTDPAEQPRTQAPPKLEVAKRQAMQE